MPGPHTTLQDGTRPAQRTGQQPARARKTTSISSQNRMFRITIVRLLAGIVNRTTPISKQKMFMRRRQPQGTGSRVQGSGKNKTIKKDRGDIPRSFPCSLSVPWTLNPGPYSSMMAIASISIIASGFTSAFTTTPVAEGNPFLKYFLRTAAVSLYRSRVVT